MQGDNPLRGAAGARARFTQLGRNKGSRLISPACATDSGQRPERGQAPGAGRDPSLGLRRRTTCPGTSQRGGRTGGRPGLLRHVLLFRPRLQWHGSVWPWLRPPLVCPPPLQGPIRVLGALKRNNEEVDGGSGWTYGTRTGAPG